MTIRISTLERAAAVWLFAGLVTAMVAGNEGWRIGPVLIGQVISWINDAAAVALVLTRFHDRNWARGLVGATIAAKALTIVGVAPALSDLAFDVALCGLFCAAGAIVVSEGPGIVYRQLLLVALLSVPVMVLQMTGLAPWSEALNTEHTEDAPDTSPTLFVGSEDLHYRTAQARPSGLTHSNNFLSLLAAFAVALHFSRVRTPYLTWRDVAVTTFAVLTMAKIALLVLAAVLVWKLLRGAPVDRRRAVRVATFVGVLLVAYGVVFPGLLESNLGLFKIKHSFFIRVNDLAAQLPQGGFRSWLEEQLAGTPKADKFQGGGLSGYAQVITLLPLAVIGALLLLPLASRGWIMFRRRYSQVIDTTVVILFLVVLYPAAVPILRAQIFWFIAGFALLPLFIVWEPRRFAGPLGRLSRPPLTASVAR